MAHVIRHKRSNQPGRSDSDAASKRFLLTLPCVLFALACIACNAASTYVPPQHLKTTLAQIHKAEWGEPIPATMDGQPITIGPGHSPVVTISVNDQCERIAQRAHMRASCEPFRRVPYTDVRVEGEVVKVRGDPPAIIPLDGIEVVQVQLQGIDRPSWQPKWGFGAAAGATGSFGLRGEVLAWKWLALECGAIPTSAVVGVSLGMRLRPVEMGIARPYIGGFSATLLSMSDQGGDEATLVAGPRLGVDIMVTKHWMVEVEAAAMYMKGDRQVFYRQPHAWGPWGGVAAVYFF